MRKPIIHLYTLCKNEGRILPLFLNYYEEIVDKITVFDNGSTDNTLDILRKNGKCEVINFDTKGEVRDDIFMLIKNSVWKVSVGVADWVIVCDTDEFVYSEDLFGYLDFCKKNKYSICETKGYDMISDKYPTSDKQITEQVRKGVFSEKMSKPLLFDPNLIDQIYFHPGGHEISPEGKVKIKKSDGLLLLHYKYLGGVDYLLKRWNDYGENLSEINKLNNWSTKRTVPEELIKRYHHLTQRSKDVFTPSLIQRIKSKLAFFK